MRTTMGKWNVVVAKPLVDGDKIEAFAIKNRRPRDGAPGVYFDVSGEKKTDLGGVKHFVDEQALARALYGRAKQELLAARSADWAITRRVSPEEAEREVLKVMWQRAEPVDRAKHEGEAKRIAHLLFGGK